MLILTTARAVACFNCSRVQDENYFFINSEKFEVPPSSKNMQTRFCESQLLNSEKTWVENTSHLHILRYGCYDSRVVPVDTKLMWKGKPPEKNCKLRLFYETVLFVTGRPICTVQFFWTNFCCSLKNYKRTTSSFLLHFFMEVCFLFCCNSSWGF